MSADFLSQIEVDALLRCVCSEKPDPDDAWAKDMAAQFDYEQPQHKGTNTMYKTIVSNEGSIVNFSIHCGDWIYPYRDSLSSVQYPIDFPLVLMLFPQEGCGKEIVGKGAVYHHLSNSRRLHCTWNHNRSTLSLDSLTNDHEPKYSEVLPTPLVFPVDLETLPCKNSVHTEKLSVGKNHEVSWGIFVTSILLMDYLKHVEQNQGKMDYPPWGNPELCMRKATPREIESIGRW